MGFDQATLEAIAGPGRGGQLVVPRRDPQGRGRGGVVLGRRRRPDAREVFSVTKSISSTLVGLAQADGDLKLTDPAADYIPEWKGTDSAGVTVQNLVSNDSGREWSLALDYDGLIRPPTTRPSRSAWGRTPEPGTTWAYNNSAIQTLDEVLRSATGERPRTTPPTTCSSRSAWPRREMTGDGADRTPTFMGVHTTCEDLARFGYLFLRHGTWDGNQVLPEEWVEEATGDSSQDSTTPTATCGGSTAREPSSEPDAGGRRPGGRRRAEGQMVPGAPEDMFWALGLQNQIVAVDPGSETVVVRIGGNPDAGQPAFTQAEAARVVTEALTGTEWRRGEHGATSGAASDSAGAGTPAGGPVRRAGRPGGGRPCRCARSAS